MKLLKKTPKKTGTDTVPVCRTEQYHDLYVFSKQETLNYMSAPNKQVWAIGMCRECQHRAIEASGWVVAEKQADERMEQIRWERENGITDKEGTDVGRALLRVFPPTEAEQKIEKAKQEKWDIMNNPNHKSFYPSWLSGFKPTPPEARTPENYIKSKQQ